MMGSVSFWYVWNLQPRKKLYTFDLNHADNLLRRLSTLSSERPEPAAPRAKHRWLQVSSEHSRNKTPKTETFKQTKFIFKLDSTTEKLEIFIIQQHLVRFNWQYETVFLTSINLTYYNFVSKTWKWLENSKLINPNPLYLKLPNLARHGPRPSAQIVLISRKAIHEEEFIPACRDSAINQTAGDFDRYNRSIGNVLFNQRSVRRSGCVSLRPASNTAIKSSRTKLNLPQQITRRQMCKLKFLGDSQTLCSLTAPRCAQNEQHKRL